MGKKGAGGGKKTTTKDGVPKGQITLQKSVKFKKGNSPVVPTEDTASFNKDNNIIPIPPSATPSTGVVRVTGLPHFFVESDLREWLEQIGDIKRIHIMRSRKV